MAVTHNAAANATVNGDQVASVPVTVLAGTNRVAILAVAYATHVDEVDAAALDSVTWDGVAATFIQLINASGVKIAQYYVTETSHNLSTGAHTAVATWSGGTVIGVLGVEVMDNAGQLGQTVVIGQKNTNSATTNAPTVAVTLTTAGSLISDIVGVHNPLSPTETVGALQSSRWNALDNITLTTNDRLRCAGSTEPSPSGGTITMSWTQSAVRAWANAACEILEFTAPPAPTNGAVYTSYDVGMFLQGSPEAERVPEEAQRAWTGDTRYQR
jgi:hypothetical protein